MKWEHYVMCIMWYGTWRGKQRKNVFTKKGHDKIWSLFVNVIANGGSMIPDFERKGGHNYNACGWRNALSPNVEHCGSLWPRGALVLANEDVFLQFYAWFTWLRRLQQRMQILTHLFEHYNCSFVSVVFVCISSQSLHILVFLRQQSVHIVYKKLQIVFQEGCISLG